MPKMIQECRNHERLLILSRRESIFSTIRHFFKKYQSPFTIFKKFCTESFYADKAAVMTKPHWRTATACIRHCVKCSSTVGSRRHFVHYLRQILTDFHNSFTENRLIFGEDNEQRQSSAFLRHSVYG